MTRVDLATLLTALDGDRQAAMRHRALALSLTPRLEDELVQTAVAASIHHFYSAIESAIERVLRGFGQSSPSGERWPQEVLELALMAVAGVRPAILSTASVSLLRRLLAFRHFFRHAYSVTWDVAELRRNLATLDAVGGPLMNDLDVFAAALRSAISPAPR